MCNSTMSVTGTVTIPLEEFEIIRSDAGEYRKLKQQLAACTTADFTEYKEEIKRMDPANKDLTDKEIDTLIMNAAKKIKIKVNKKAVLDILLDFICYRRSGDYGYFDEESKEDMKKHKIQFK